MNRWILCCVVSLAGCTGVEGMGGPKGADGQNGQDGKDGVSTLLILQRQDAAAGCNGGPGVVASSYQDVDGSGTVTTGDKLLSQAVVCDGTNGTSGTNGSDGAPGPQGPQGPAGADGASCTVQAVDADPTGPAPNGGALISCGTTSTLVLNGAPGAPGPQGEPGTPAPPTAFSVVSVIDPCGDAPGIFDEVFLRLANGQLIASFSDDSSGTNTRLSILVDGSFMTSDGSSCAFTVSTDTSTTPATRTISWAGGSESWPLDP
jgi:hypothetical protein